MVVLLSLCTLSVSFCKLVCNLHKLLTLQFEMGVATGEKELGPGVTGNLEPQEVWHDMVLNILVYVIPHAKL